ncbi:alpha/beta hydrolase [Acinetobacter puyangensis]|uniref:Acetyl esterase/lipase n=1 Tax=Acinetobacter puyangensis TaxID=1096779 RepID=A0A240ECK5_9GAMM|nr:alpha/beta hydrolase [Acinetobacter puyangensis]SNX45983.1 Acetyl esterase/lipase [Acinetobacter puyangensis]
MPKTSQLTTFAIEKILKATIKFPSEQGLSANTLRKLLVPTSKLLPVNRSLHFKKLHLAGMPCEEIKVRNEDPTQMIFHIHGGAFFLGGLDSHRGLMSDLVTYTKAQVLHLDYPLAPEHPFPYALDLLFAAYLEILQQGIEPKDITLSGDSCGGNLALALCLKLRDEKLPLPSGLILMSPWLDLSLTGESLKFNAKQDTLLSEQLLKQGIEYYITDDNSIDEPYISPLFANLSGLPEILIQVGSKEILLDDAKRLKEYVEQAGGKATLSIYPGMWHNFHMFNHWVEQAKQALNDIARFVDHVDR